MQPPRREGRTMVLDMTKFADVILYCAVCEERFRPWRQSAKRRGVADERG